MMRLRSLAGALIGLMLAMGSGHSQDFGMVMFNDSIDLTNSYVAQSAMASVANANAKANARRSGSTAGKKALRTLGFRSDPAVSAKVKARFRSQLVQSNPAQAAIVDAALKADWLKGYGAEIARPNGLDARNLADGYTAYLVASWALVNNVETLSARSIKAARDTMRAAMIADPKISRMTDGQKQEAAEDLIYNTVLVMANRIHISKSGDASLQRSAAENYSDLFQKQGIDLAALTLTEGGFVRR